MMTNTPAQWAKVNITPMTSFLVQALDHMLRLLTIILYGNQHVVITNKAMQCAKVTSFLVQAPGFIIWLPANNSFGILISSNDQQNS
jgi:hypothetical protein